MLKILAVKSKYPQMSNRFSAEAHFESKIKQGTIESQGKVLRFTSQPFEPKKRTIEKGLRRICVDRFSFEDFKEINKLHCEYLQKLKGNLPPSAFLDVLYKAELTGARIKIAKKEGFVVEERKNVLVVIFEDCKTKIFPKKVWDFRLLFDGVEYLFLTENLKKNRFLG